MLIFDPESAPIDSVAGEAAVDPSNLNLGWIRHRFAAPPQWQPETTDEQRFFSAQHDFKRASVLIALVQRDHGLNVLFTRRTEHLSQHAGQISFPGGRQELSDSDAIETALRETEEEIGLDRALVDVLGTLPDYLTITGYRVTLVVGAIQDLPWLHSDPEEVAEIFEVPLSFLMDGQVHQRRRVVVPGDDNQQILRTFYAMPYQHHFIWGATAGMLRNLFHFLRARTA